MNTKTSSNDASKGLSVSALFNIKVATLKCRKGLIMKNYILIDMNIGLLTLNTKMSVYFDRLQIRQYDESISDSFAIEYYTNDDYKGSIECSFNSDTIVNINEKVKEITTIEELKNLVK